MEVYVVPLAMYGAPSNACERANDVLPLKIMQVLVLSNQCVTVTLKN